MTILGASPAEREGDLQAESSFAEARLHWNWELSSAHDPQTRAQACLACCVTTVWSSCQCGLGTSSS